MIRTWLARVETGTACLAGAAAAALGLRLMISAVAFAQAEPAPPPAAVETKPALESLAEELTTKAKAVEAPPTVAPAAAAGGSPLRLTLSIVAGPERSEVFVNGARLGFAPYLGDFTCKQGEPLRIEVVPEKGPLIERQASCAGRNVFIRE